MKFWLNNRIDQEYELRFDELVAGFASSRWSRATNAENPWPVERRMAAWLAESQKGVWDVDSEAGRSDFATLCDAALNYERSVR